MFCCFFNSLSVIFSLLGITSSALGTCLVRNKIMYVIITFIQVLTLIYFAKKACNTKGKAPYVVGLAVGFAITNISYISRVFLNNYISCGQTFFFNILSLIGIIITSLNIFFYRKNLSRKCKESECKENHTATPSKSFCSIWQCFCKYIKCSKKTSSSCDKKCSERDTLSCDTEEQKD